MVKNYLKMAWRNLLKHKGHTAINVFGLAVGMACFLLILFYVKDESSFDKFHKDYDRVYRITEVNYSDGGDNYLANAYSAIGPALKSDFPEFEAFVRLHIEEFSVANGPEKKFQEPNFAFADSTLWEVLDFGLLEGDKASALADPFSIVITESMASKYFGDDDAMGKTLKVDGQYDFQVTGILKDLPKNSHMQFDFLASFISLRQLQGGWMFNNWYWPPMYTYVKVPAGANVENMEAKFPAMVEKYLGKLTAEQRGYQMQPLEEIHTTTDYANELGKTTNKTYLLILTTTAFLILAIACVNFMNLSLARSISRSGEVGVRKVFGAVREQIIVQYLSESVLVTIISGVIGFGFFLLAMPAFNGLTEKSLEVAAADVPLILGGLIVIALIVGFLSGIYPALFLSGFSPAAILKGKVAKQSPFASLFKKSLITFQFVISAALIISTFIIYFQLQFMRNKALGFDKEQTVVLEVRSLRDQTRIKTLKDRLNQLPQVRGTAVSSRIPGHEGFYDYNVLPEGETAENNMLFMRLETDLDFASLYEFEVLKGRGFDNRLSTDSLAYLINETAAAQLGWDESDLNKKLNMGSLNQDGTFRAVHTGSVIGIVKDFNFISLHNDVDPVVISVIPSSQPYMQGKLSVKLASGDLMESMQVIEEEWRQFTAASQFEYFFLDDSVERMYAAEKQLGKVFLTFSSISIILACLGLLAMTTLLAAQLKKEIGIRKVLGATVGSIVLLMSKGYMQLITISFVIASVITYLVMEKWLENFAYHIQMQVWYFLLAGVVLGLISFITMSFKSLKAAYGNPVEALRYE
ncbi:ABC transporter permease [Roseivirga sp. E12]|uniref:ABC transporter permease n=1 Tax=Roseivirga sp. E12 TaxID=2819237 RepID=UPI001ABBF16C|nr:ABC transporter permease [Roseivirga sp. E12]MBO3698536.1 ABC transporter permease [Roseivirga sp. E12]